MNGIETARPAQRAGPVSLAPDGRRRLRFRLVSAACIAAVMAVSTGCARIPFERPRLMPIGTVDPLMIARDFDDQLPARFETQETLTFSYLWKDIPVLGMTQVDVPARAFEVVGMNHVGVPLFGVGGDGSGNRLHYAVPEFRKHSQMTDAVGNDLRHIYFGRVPGADAEAEVLADRVVFREKGQDGTLEHVFGGEGNLLLEKRLRHEGTVKWRVNYYRYAFAEKNRSDSLYPAGIVYYNYAAHYRLIIRVRSLHIIEPAASDSQP